MLLKNFIKFFNRLSFGYVTLLDHTENSERTVQRKGEKGEKKKSKRQTNNFFNQLDEN